MAERVLCSKCGSSNTSLVNQTPAWGRFPEGVEFSCMMCGLRLYGQKALDRAEEWQAEMQQREALMTLMRQQEARRISEAKIREASLRLQVSALRAEKLEVKPPEVKPPEVTSPAPLEVSEASPEAPKLDPKLDPKQRKRERDAARRQRLRLQKLEGKLPEASKFETKCSWVDCSNTRAAKSKYCSKKCSNKFAHAAEKQRKIAKSYRP
jgi:hypothetical protein